MKPLDHAQWHCDNCKIEQTIGYLDSDEEALHIIAFSRYQDVEL